MANHRDLQLNSGMRCAKYMLLTVSFMFAITAILLIMVGTTIQAILGDFASFIDDSFWSPPALLIAIGFLMLCVAALGAYGALKESVLLINLFGVSLFMVFILEVAAAIASFIMRDQVYVMLDNNMAESFSYYEDNNYAQNGIDFMQSGLECCGIDGPSDWINYWAPNKNQTNEKIWVPSSCCGRFDETLDNCELQFNSGCLPRLTYIISQSITLIATGATTVAFVQLLGVLCAFMLAKTLRRNKSIREARRWQYQQSLGILISGGKVVSPANSPMTGYTQLEKSSEGFRDNDPITYTPTSPSVN